VSSFCSIVCTYLPAREDQSMPRRTLAGSTMLVILILLSSAVALAASRNFRTHLNGRNEVPVRATNAQGQVILKLDEDGSRLHYKLNVANIENVFQAHLHMAPVGENGPIVAWLYPSAPPAVPIPGRTQGTLAEGAITADDLMGPLAGQSLEALLEAIAAGNIYANVHTNDFVDPPNTGPGDFPGGEIRGQVNHDH
jgi:hypothetical protein